MAGMPPSFSVAVNMKKRACVLDTPLVLSRYGLLLAQRLCDEFDLWLVRELWQILDNTQYYLEHPELLAPERPKNPSLLAIAEQLNDEEMYYPALKVAKKVGNKYSGYANETRINLLHNILTQWEVLRGETDLAGLKVFWLNDAMSESLLPAGVDQNLVYRFETLASSLDLRTDKENKENTLYTDSFRDAAALAATLTPYKGFILTCQGPKSDDFPDGEPFICSYLREWGIRCRRIMQDEKGQIEREIFNPVFARAGITELMWLGLNLAVVHVIVPEAIIMPPSKKEEVDLQNDIPLSEEKENGRKDWWKEAVCFWYPL